MLELLEEAYFVLWQQLGVVFVDAELGGYALGNGLAVAGEHNGALYTQLFQGFECFGAVFFYLVADDYVAGVVAVDGDVYDGSRQMAFMPVRADAVHQFAIAHAYDASFHVGAYALACNLFDVGYLTAVGGLVGVGVAQGGTDGVGGEVLDVSGEVQEVRLAVFLGVDGLDGKASVGQRAGLVEDHCVDL